MKNISSNFPNAQLLKLQAEDPIQKLKISQQQTLCACVLVTASGGAWKT